jgi:hypothetical protein
MRIYLLCPILALASVSGLYAQDARGDILGRVSDPTGAVVVGATVRAVRTATNVQTTASTNATGDYTLAFLLPGEYEISVEATGFKKFLQQGISVRVSEKTTMNVTLELGSTTETIKVVGEAPLVESATASLGQVVDQRRIAELPLKDGNPMMLADLSPGVLFTGNPSWSRPFDNGTASSMATSGTRTGSNEYTMDGAPNTGGTNGSVGYVPPMAVVEEFKIQTATFDASNGYSPGAAVNVSLKSGTNELHGALHEFVQNTALGANSYFSNMAGRPRDINRQNRWSASGTGPVYIPKIYNGKNKTFWMYGYEGIADYFPRETLTTSVPTDKEKQGDFSDLLKLGTIYQIYDPKTIQTAPNGRTTRQPFANNVIPTSRIDPIATKLLPFYPKPNLPGTADGTNNYTTPNSDTDNFYSHVFRIDHNFSDRHRAFFRGDVNQRFQRTALQFRGTGLPPTNGTNNWRQNRGAVLDDVYVFNPQFLMNVRYAYTRYFEPVDAVTSGWNPVEYGFSQKLVDQIKREDPRRLQLPTISPAGYYALGNSSRQANHAEIHDFAGSFTRMIRSHTLRFGAEFRAYRNNNASLGAAAAGSLTFSTDWTRGPLDNSAAAPMGQGLASFLLGLPTSGQIDVNDSLAQQVKVPSVYVQDDWKLSSKLTFNMGLRYEIDYPLTERYNRTVRGFNSSTALPIEATVQTNYARSPIPEIAAGQLLVRGGLTYAGVGGEPRTLWKANTTNFAPRIGLAYQLNGRTVVRTGYGVFYDLDRQSVTQTGFSLSTAFVPTVDNGLSFVASAADPFPNGWNKPAGASLGMMTNVGQSITFFNPNLRTPYVQRWQFGLQREIARQTVVEVSYVGNRGTKIRTTRALDAVPRKYYSTLPERDQTWINYITQSVSNPFYPLLPGTSLAGSTVGRSQLLRPWPQFTGIGYTTNEGYSWYHSLQTRFEKRLSAGYTTTVAWTWSKFMEATGFLNETDPRPERVISDQDRTHRLVVSGIYELPFGKGRRWLANAPGIADKLIGGWQISGIFQGQSGAALGFGDSILYGSLSDIPIANSKRTIYSWFNVSGFERASAKQRAWDIRTMPSRYSGVRGDGMNNWDLSVIKNTHFNEHGYVELRAEFINALNHAQFTAPNTTPTSTAFGTVSGINQFPRIIQLGLRVVF